MKRTVAFLIWFWLAPGSEAFIWASCPDPNEAVTVRPDGLAIVQREVVLPASRDVVRSTLMDYSRWKELVSEYSEVGLETVPDGTPVMTITTPISKVWLLKHLWKTELKTTIVETGKDRLESKLMGGDFYQYSQIWEFANGPEEGTTEATFMMKVKPKSWAYELTKKLSWDWRSHVCERVGEEVRDFFLKLQAQLELSNHR